MISITTYWQQFKDCITHLQPSEGNKEYSNQIAVANHLIEIGLTTEQIGITEIQHIGDKLHDQAKLFGYRVSFNSPEKKYEFYLPKITNTETLVFATVYYQHLANYENVDYQGSIYWFRNRVIAGVNEKKIPTRAQSKAMLAEIKNYCTTHHISVNEAEFFKKETESAKDYTTRLFQIFSPDAVVKNESNEPTNLNQPDELAKLGTSLEALKNKRKRLITQMDSFTQKLAECHQTSANYVKLNTEWNNKWFFTKLFYWITSWFSQNSLLNNLKAAHKQVVTAEDALNQEFSPSSTAETYRAELKKQLEEITVECNKAQEQISQYKLNQLEIKLKQLEQKQQEKEQKTITAALEPIKTIEAPEIPEIKPKTNTNSNGSISNLSHCYSFFKEHMPKPEILGAIAAAGAAIVVQNFL
ncbi:hypothetical protein EP47_08480 [Legionella norrlandica]|uniref:Uncharacterized protein n=1 Tax=Legionella norrlandica TaxID=1498499 RepID=A0A0A2SS70_9GAMM|nr:hypothetical protein [Legionella norrlandica]KGP63935.1 hypothetical protein EP47_08480 [Legionella norrlandica]